MSVEVSVVIPVYNAAPHLEACMEALLNQTFRDCEFIWINDGSVDQSEEMLESYRAKDARIRVIHQSNEGVSSARNRGILAAKGRYIGFVDADDVISPNFYETLYNAAIALDSDVVFSNLSLEQAGQRLCIDYDFPVQTQLNLPYIEEVLLPYLIQADNFNSVCTKLYRRQLIEQHQILFPKDVPLGEDGWFNMLYFSKASSAQYIDYTGYHYRDVIGSATRNAQHRDYFARSLEVFKRNDQEIIGERIQPEELTRLKSIKLIQSLVDFAHMYASSATGMSMLQRIRYLKQMVAHPEVTHALPSYYAYKQERIGRYERLFLKFIAIRSATGMFMLANYSQFRAKEKSQHPLRGMRKPKGV